MKLRPSKLFLYSSILLAFDSVLKVPFLGFYIQAGVLSFLLFAILEGLNKYNRKKITLNVDYGILLITLYLLLHCILAINIGIYFKMLLYFLIPLFFYITFKSLIFSTDVLHNTAKIVLIILIISGLMEYGLKNYFNIHLEFKDMNTEYYLNNGDLAKRLRGFFLEPNWYGLSIFSWLYVYFRSAKFKGLLFYSVILLSLFCLILSGNRLILLFILLLSIAWFLKPRLIKIQGSLFLITIITSVILFFLLALNMDFLDDRSAIARFYTASNVYSELKKSSILNLLFGFGFSNWGVYSNLLELSWSNYLFDQALTRRDNSELYVVFFELGLFGGMLFLLDIILLANKRNADFIDKVFFFLFYFAAMFYPIFTFITYLIPVILIRARIYQETKWQ